MAKTKTMTKVTHYMPEALLEWMRRYCKKNAVAQSRLLTMLVTEFRQGVDHSN